MISEINPNLLKPRWSKVVSDLWDNKMRTILVIASIAGGVFVIGIIISSYVILREDISVSYASVNPANIEIWTDPFQEDFARLIEQVPGVDNSEGALILGIRARRGSENWKSLALIVIDDFEGSNINQLAQVEGVRYPDRGEMTISYSNLSSSGFVVGDIVEIELPNGSRHFLPVVGLVTDQANSRPGINANAYIRQDTLSSLGLNKYFNRFWITVDGDGGDEKYIADIAALVEDRIERNQRQVYRTETSLSNEHPLADTILAILGVLGVLGGLIAILSSSLIINTLNALLAQHLRQIGVMKLIGGRSSQILGMYMLLIVAYGVIALIITVPTGAIGGYGLAGFIADQIGAGLQGFRIVPIAITIQFIIAFLIPLVAGFFPVSKGSRIKVHQAISNYRPENHTTQLDIINKVTSQFRWLSRPILLAIRNTFRKKGRLLLTIFSLTIAGAVFIAVFNVSASLDDFIGKINQNFLGDISVNFSQPYSISRVKQVILPIPGINDVEGWAGAEGEIWDAQDNLVANISIIAPPQNTELINPDFVAGRWINPKEKQTVVVSDTIYDLYPNIEPGDTIIVKIPGNRKEAWTVVGIFRFTSAAGVDVISYADFDYIAGLIGLPNQATSFRLSTEKHDLESQAELSQLIDKYLEDRGFSVSLVLAGEQQREDSSKGIDILVTFLLVMALLTAFVGSIGLAGTMGMNVLERTREIGVMRAIGAVDFVIMQLVVIEGLIIGLITWVLAIGFSFPISSLLNLLMGEAMLGSPLSFIFNPIGILIWFAVVIVLSLVASIVPARNAVRLTIREVLAYE